MSDVLIASITELCVPDHNNDTAAIAAWTANKTPEGVGAMFANPNAMFFVAERHREIAAVGCVLNGNQIGLNYVDPAHRFQGVSRALLKAMEQAIRDAGYPEARLEATKTGHNFYRANGWQDAVELTTGRFIDALPMRKVL